MEHQMEERDQETIADLSSKHGEIAAKKAQIFEAASNTFLVALRVYYSQLQQFVMDRMPDALRIWEDVGTDNLTLAPVGVAFSCPARCVPEQVGEVMDGVRDRGRCGRSSDGRPRGG